MMNMTALYNTLLIYLHTTRFSRHRVVVNCCELQLYKNELNY